MNRRHDAAMFDILVYLFENFFHAEAYPEPEQLALKLSAAGFEDDEISEALQWLDGLREAGSDSLPTIATPAAGQHDGAGQDPQARMRPHAVHRHALQSSCGNKNSAIARTRCLLRVEGS